MNVSNFIAKSETYQKKDKSQGVRWVTVDPIPGIELNLQNVQGENLPAMASLFRVDEGTLSVRDGDWGKILTVRVSKGAPVVVQYAPVK